MNEVAAELIRAATRQFGDGVFTIEPNDEDPQADPGSVVLAFPHPRRLRHRAAVIQRGNAFEVAYSDGGAIGPAEALFVFADAGLRRTRLKTSSGSWTGFSRVGSSSTADASVPWLPGSDATRVGVSCALAPAKTSRPRREKQSMRCTTGGPSEAVRRGKTPWHYEGGKAGRRVVPNTLI